MPKRDFHSISTATSSAGLKGTSFTLVCCWEEKLDFPKESNYVRHLRVNEIALSSYENFGFLHVCYKEIKQQKSSPGCFRIKTLI